MKIIEHGLKPSGRLKISLYGPDGYLKQEMVTDNLVTSVGLQHIAALLSSAGASGMTHMAVGSGSTSAALGDTTLGAELARVALSSRLQLVGADANKCQYVASFPAGTATGNLTEAGIFNNSSGGVILSRTVFASLTKGANDVLQITWTLTVG